jgi:hypothetical protein
VELIIAAVGIVVAVLLWLFPPGPLRRRLRIRHDEVNWIFETDSTSYEYFRGPYVFDPAGADASSSRPILNELDSAKRKADTALVHQLGDQVPVERLRTINDYTFKIFRHMRFVQKKWFEANGRFFQGKPTMASPPSHVMDGKIEFAFGLTDQVDDWRDIGYVDRLAPVELRCDMYEGPQGHGYIVTASVRVNGEVWRNEMHVGPEPRGVIQYLWTRQQV